MKHEHGWFLSFTPYEENKTFKIEYMKIGDIVRYSDGFKAERICDKYRESKGIIVGFVKNGKGDIARVLWDGAPKYYTIATKFLIVF